MAAIMEEEDLKCTPATSDYKYERLKDALNEIRIVELLPAVNQSDPIECQLSAQSLHSTPKYIALSYTWGDSNVCDIIYIDGYTASVTTNLASALRRLRKKEGSLFMWVDSISIDQRFESEKSEQVKKMRDIYEKALDIYVWLGDEDQTSALAWSLLKRLQSLPDDSISTIIQNSDLKEGFQALHNLFRRPYWSRIVS